MRRTYLILGGLLALGAASCSDGEQSIEEVVGDETGVVDVPHAPVPMSISVGMPETRLDYERSADSKFVTVTWSNDDNLQVFNASDNTKYVDFAMQTNNGATADFYCADVSPLAIGDGADVTAIYPYRVESESSPGKKVVSMKNQTIQSNGNGDSSMDVMVAHAAWKSENMSFQFTHLMASIIVQLNFSEATTVKNIVMTADGGFNNYATIEMTANGGTELGDFKKGPINATTTGATATTQYMGQLFVVPGTYTNISLIAITDKGHFECTKEVTATLDQGMNYRLQVLADAWHSAPLYAWGTDHDADNGFSDTDFNEMQSATDEPNLYFLGAAGDNYNNCVNGNGSLKFTLTNQSSSWAVFMPEVDSDSHTFWPEYNDPIYPSWGNKNVVRVNVVSGEVKAGWRRPIYYVGQINGWDEDSANGSKYLLTCDINDENRIDEFTVRLTLNDGYELKFPLDHYWGWDYNFWNNEFILAPSENASIEDGANYVFSYGNTVGGAPDYKFRVNDAAHAGTYDIVINVVDQTINFTKVP